jgi:cephalosporin hydroxylase
MANDQQVSKVNPSAGTQFRRSSSRTAFLRIVTILSLALACSEFFLAVHYRRGRDAAETKDSAVERFQVLYYASSVWSHTKWFGIRSEQAPTDNWSMQEIISEIQPDYIIETGTMNGGTTLFYAAVLSYANPSGKVITIDIAPQVQDASRMPLWKQRVEMIVGSSVDPEVTDRVAREVQGKKVLVTLDSLHTRDHVLKEIQVYSKLVTPGSYLVVQDTNLNGHPIQLGLGPGPGEAVQEFLKTDNNFVADRSREKFMLTDYPGGWLKRLK